MSQIDLPLAADAPGAAEAPAATGPAAWWRRLLRDPMAVAALLVLAAICLAALFAPSVAFRAGEQTTRVPPPASGKPTAATRHALQVAGCCPDHPL